MPTQPIKPTSPTTHHIHQAYRFEPEGEEGRAFDLLEQQDGHQHGDEHRGRAFQRAVGHGPLVAPEDRAEARRLWKLEKGDRGVRMVEVVER